jgi:hypothetical protein
LGADKQGVLACTVVDDIVHDDAHAAGMRLAQQFVKVFQRAVGGLYGAKVGCGIAMITVGAGGDGHEPDALDAQVFQIVQLLDQASSGRPRHRHRCPCRRGQTLP